MARKIHTHIIGGIGNAAVGAIAAVLATTGVALAQTPAPRAANPPLIGLGGAAGPATAQPGQPQGQPPAPQWTKICGPDPTTNKNLCVVQEGLVDGTGHLVASATIRSVQDDPKMQFIVSVPPGMLIQPGLQFEIDTTGKATPMKYSICFPNACYADMDVTADFVKSLRAGKQLAVASLDQSGQTQAFPLPLAGFGTVYDGPGTTASTSGQDANSLTSSLQAHADAARQALTNQQQPKP